MKYIIRHYDHPETFEVEAMTKARIRKLIETECHDRTWIVDDTWAEEVTAPSRSVERRSWTGMERK